MHMGPYSSQLQVRHADRRKATERCWGRPVATRTRIHRPCPANRKPEHACCLGCLSASKSAVWLHCPTLWPSWMSGSAAGQQLAGLRQLRGRWRSIHVPVFRRTDGRLDGTSTRVTATKRCDEADAGQVFDRTCGTESRVGLHAVRQGLFFFPQRNRWFPGCTRRVYRHTRSIKPRRQAMFRNEINHVPFRLVSVGWCTDRTFSPLSRRPL